MVTFFTEFFEQTVNPLAFRNHDRRTDHFLDVEWGTVRA
ncbi:Uncharacterised protein [Vibrio cholerae]|nr:Uncharacterised protein [Vibrio cholerae]